jgi:hypothetical protein
MAAASTSVHDSDLPAADKKSNSNHASAEEYFGDNQSLHV